MHIKNFTLYSLPYFVGIASLVVAAHQAAPTLRFEDPSTESAITLDQVVNRSVKGDRLPIEQTVPQTNDKVPTRIAPSPEIKIACQGPIEVNGRCFADAALKRTIQGFYYV